jgi:hypothetical protein
LFEWTPSVSNLNQEGFQTLLDLAQVPFHDLRKILLIEFNNALSTTAESPNKQLKG